MAMAWPEGRCTKIGRVGLLWPIRGAKGLRRRFCMREFSWKGARLAENHFATWSWLLA